MKRLLVTGFFTLCIPLMAQVLQPLGSGLPARVVASYAAGNDYLALFQQNNPSSGGDPIYTVARWNGTYWSYYTGGLNMPTAVKDVNGTYNYHSVAIYHDTMYVGANITNATGEAASNVNHLYRWNGSNWEPVLNTISSKTDGILAMTVFKDRLVVAGRFSNNVGGGKVQNIVSYNGSKWEFVGQSGSDIGTDGSINCLVSDGKRLYIGGKFKTFNGDWTGNIAFYTDANGGWGGYGSKFIGTGSEVLELAVFNGSIAALGINQHGEKEIRIFNNGNWSDPLGFDTFTLSDPTTIAGAGEYLLIGGTFESGGNGTSILRYNNGQLEFTGTRISGNFGLGQRGSEAFAWGDFTETNTGIHNIAKIETTYGDVVGKLYFDKNQDCQKNGNDIDLAATLIRFENEADRFWFASTDSFGRFAIALPEGNYSITALTGRNWLNNCPTNYQVRVRKGLYSFVSLGQYMAPDVDDAEVHMFDATPPTVKPGDQVHLFVRIKNTGSTTLNGPTIQVRHDLKLSNFSSVPAADNYDIATGEATYTLVNAGPNEERYIDITLTVPAGAAVGDQYFNTIKTGSLFTGSDKYPGDNYDTATIQVGTYNGSVVKTSELGGTVNYKITKLSYYVKFTNISQSMVKRVQLTDTLAKNVTIMNVDFTGKYPLKGNPGLNTSLDSQVVLFAPYEDANLTAFEADPGKSFGFIQYDVYLKYHLKHGDVVYNRATADFDSKWKGCSNTVAVTMVDPNVGIRPVSGSIHRVYPNPASNDVFLEFARSLNGNLDVVDCTGKVVQTYKLNGNQMKLNVAELTPGIYLIRCEEGSAMLSVSR